MGVEGQYVTVQTRCRKCETTPSELKLLKEYYKKFFSNDKNLRPSIVKCGP